MLIFLWQQNNAVGTTAKMTASGEATATFDSGVTVRPALPSGGTGYRRRRPYVPPPLPPIIELPESRKSIRVQATFTAIGESQVNITAIENGTFEAGLRRLRAAYPDEFALLNSPLPGPSATFSAIGEATVSFEGQAEGNLGAVIRRMVQIWGFDAVDAGARADGWAVNIADYSTPSGRTPPKKK